MIQSAVTDIESPSIAAENPLRFLGHVIFKF